MGKISNYARVLAAKLQDVFVCDQTDSNVTTTKSVTVEQIGDAICGEQVHADLETDDQTIIGGINEVNDKADTNTTAIGDLSQLTTTDKSSLVGAVNEVNAKYTNLGVTRIARGTANMDTTTKTITLSGFTSTPTIVATPYAYFKEVWITSASSSGFTINMNSTGAFVNWIAIGN